MTSTLKFILLLFILFHSVAHSQKWQGHWSSSFGDIKIMEKIITAQNAGLVFGNYAKTGTLMGVSFGGELHGFFFDKKTQQGGDFVFLQRDTGQSFTGKWSYQDKSNKLDWNGNKIDSNLPTDILELDRFRSAEGNWASNFGPLDIVQNGVYLEAQYSDKGRIYAVYNQANKMIYGLFTNKQKYGLLQFVLNSEQNKFKGLWSWQTKNWSDQIWSGTK